MARKAAVNGLKVVGQPVPLREGKEKVTGAAKYSADIQLEGMLYAKTLGSPHAHALIKKIDTGAAEKMKGVIGILTHENTAGLTYASVETPVMGVLEKQVRYVGEPVAVVAAETEEIAENALKAIKVEYEVLPAVFDPYEAAQPNTAKLHADGNIADPIVGEPLVMEWGDAEKALKKADIVVEGTFKTPVQPVTPIEPRATVAQWDGKVLNVWTSTQFPHRVKEDLAGVTGLSFSQISVKSHFLGGGFGGKKQEEHPSMAALLAMRTGRPVKLEYTREEETTIGRRRYSSIANMKLGAKKDGTLVSFIWECYYDVGAHGNYVGGCLGLMHGGQQYIYNLENCILRSYDCNTNRPTAQPFRGVQMPAYLFGLEQLMDQVAEKAGIDPVEIRLKNTYRTGDITKPFGAKLGNYAIEEVINSGAKAANFFETWKGWGKPVKKDGVKRTGIGVAYTTGYTEWQKHITGATVKIHPDGTAEIFCGAQDLGTGCNTTIAQIGAEELGIPLEKLRYITGDTAITPDDFGACASRTLYCEGTAVQQACKKAKEALIKAACLKLNVPSTAVEYKDGALYVKAKRVPLADVISAPVSAAYKNPKSPTIYGDFPCNYYGGCVFHVAEVEVDIDTGETRVIKYLVAQDVGKAVNPGVVEGQLYGGCLQGMGLALTEELLFDNKGRPLNPNFMDYKIYDFQDAPDIKMTLIESNEPTGPFGAVGVGEHSLSPTPAAIANAIYNATGVRMYECPMTSERVFKNLGKKNRI